MPGQFHLAAIMALVAMLGGAPAQALDHAIKVSFFPADSSLLASDSITLRGEEVGEGTVKFLINRSLIVESVQSEWDIRRWYTEEDVEASLFKQEPDSEDVQLVNRAKGVFIELAALPAPDANVTVTIVYSGVVYDSLEAPPATYARGFAETSGLIDRRGIYLSNASLWYPYQFGRMFTFRLAVDVPYDWMSVSQGRRVDERLERLRGEERSFTRWAEENPTAEIYLVAGEYYRHEAYHQGVWLMAYTYQQSDSLAGLYLDATKRYIAMYEGLIGDYPYPKFALVENFWQTGFGMPSFTLLGDKVIRLPFIVRTSYGHEILHNWWGNSVYVDYDSGNWCEGITTYGADYLYKEQAGPEEARDYRHHTLMDFNNCVKPGRDFPLSDFRERHDPSSQSIGYGKSLMVFHMLRKALGDSLFWRALREFYMESKFKVASWQDIQAVFSRVSRQDLAWYFDQWVNRAGIPTIRLAQADYQAGDGQYQLTFTLEQDSPLFIIDLPVKVATAEGTETTTVRLSGKDSTYALSTRAEPLAIAIDPDYDCFRRLYLEEIPPTLGGLFGQDSVLAVIGGREDHEARASLRSIAQSWGLGRHVIEEADFDRQLMRGHHLWFLGRGDMLADLLERRVGQVRLGDQSVSLAESDLPIAGSTLVCAVRNPYDEKLAVGIVISGDLASLRTLAATIPRYDRYSYVDFDGTTPSLRGVWEEGKSPLTMDFRER